MVNQETDLLENGSRRLLAEPNQESGERSRTLGVLRTERFSSDFAKYLVAKLGVIKFLCQDRKALCHGFREVFIVLQGLHDVDLRSERVTVMLYSKANDFVDMHADVLSLHILFRLGNMVRGAGKASKVGSTDV